MVRHESAASAELSLTLATSQSVLVLVTLCHFAERSTVRAQFTLALVAAARLHAFHHHTALRIWALRELRGIGCEHGGD